MRACRWERALRAFLALGCEKVVDSEYHIGICFKSTFIAYFRKCPMSPHGQRQLLDALRISEGDWVVALKDAKD